MRTSARLQTRPQSAFLDCRRADWPSWSCQRRLGASVLAVQPPARVRARALTSHSAAVSIVQHRWGLVHLACTHATTRQRCAHMREPCSRAAVYLSVVGADWHRLVPIHKELLRPVSPLRRKRRKGDSYADAHDCSGRFFLRAPTDRLSRE